MGRWWDRPGADTLLRSVLAVVLASMLIGVAPIGHGIGVSAFGASAAAVRGRVADAGGPAMTIHAGSTGAASLNESARDSSSPAATGPRFDPIGKKDTQQFLLLRSLLSTARGRAMLRRAYGQATVDAMIKAYGQAPVSHAPVSHAAQLGARTARNAHTTTMSTTARASVLRRAPRDQASAGTGTLRYVSPGGDDANDCLSASGAGAGQGPCRTIQGAIDKSASGDGISVAAGVYPETLAVTASLTIEGAGTDQTIVDAGGSGRVATVPGPASAVLEGLTLRGGRAPDGGSGGGGLYVAGGSAVVLANTDVVSNTADGSNADRGGGIYVAGASGVTLDESAVRGNTSTNGGGGILAVDDSAITLTNSELVSNTTGEAGGLYLGNGSTATLDGSAVTGNTANSDAGGILVYGPGSAATLTNTVVLSNSAGVTAAAGSLPRTTAR